MYLTTKKLILFRVITGIFGFCSPGRKFIRNILNKLISNKTISYCQASDFFEVSEIDKK